MIKYLIFFCFFSMVYSNDQNHLEIKPEPSISPKLLSVTDNPDYIDTTHFAVGNIYSEFTNDGRLGFSFTNNAGTFWPNATEEIVFEHGFWLIGKTNENTENETLVGAVPEFDANYTPGPMINGEAAVLATPDDFEAYRTYVIDGNSGPGDEDYDNWPSEWGPPIHSDGTPKLMGDKMAWTIYNDAHPDVHGWLETNDGGDENNTFLEVRETVWGFNDGEYESDALFYKYQVFNKGADTLTNLTISHWNDIDIMSLTWNDWGFNEDHNFGFVYYNNDSANVNLPKAVSYFLIQGPMIPEIGATAHAFGATFENRTNLNTTAFWGIGDDACSPQNYGGSPSNLIQAYNFTLGLQYDGSPIVNPVTGEETTYTFTGDPVTNEGWVSDDYCHGGMTGYIMSSGPLTLAPGDSQEVVIGLVGSSESTIEASLIDLQTKVEYLRDLYYDQLSIQEPIPIPDDFLIVKHYPNPFNPSVQFEIEMKKESLIVMTIFNIKGELIWQKKMGIKERGIHTLSWDAKNLNQEFLAAGVYLYRVNAGNHIQTGKVVYVK